VASSRRRRILALLGLAAVAVLVAIAMGWFPQEPVRQRVEARLRALLGPGARIGRLTVAPARLRATVFGLVLEGPAYRLEADHLELALAPATLRGGVVHLRALRMRGVRLLLRAAPSAIEAQASSPMAPLWIDSLAVDDGSVRYENPALGGDVVLEGVALRGAIGTGALELIARGGRWHRQPEVQLETAHARLRVDSRLVTQVDTFEAGLARSQVHARGTLGPLLEPSPDLRLQATLDLDELGRLGGLAETQGTVHVTGTVSGAKELRVSAAASAEALRVQGWPVDRAVLQIEHAPNGTSGSLDAGLLGGRAQGQARWDGQRLESHLQLGALSLSRLRQAGLLEAKGLDGRLDASVDLEGTAERAQLVAKAQVDGRLEGGQVLAGQAKARGPVSLSGRRMDATWEATLDARAEAGRLRGGHLDIVGTARGPWPPRLEAKSTGTLDIAAGERRLALVPTATLQVENGRYAAEASVAGLGAPIQLSLVGRGDRLERLSLAADGVELDALLPGARGRARLTVALSGRPAALDGTASLQIAEAGWRDIAMGSAAAEMTLRGGRAEASLTLPELHARAALVAPPGARSVIEGTLDLESTPLAPFAPLLPPTAADLTGDLGAHVTFSVPLASPDQATGQAEVVSLKVDRGRWSARAVAPFRVQYAPGQIGVEALQLEGAGMRLEADGRAGTREGGRLDLRLRARSALGDAPLPEGWELAGEAEADLSLAGTLKHPEARGHVALRAARFSAPALPALSIDDGRLEMDGVSVVFPAFVVGLAGGHLTLSGRLPVAAVFPDARRARGILAPEEEAALTVEWSDIDPAALLAQVSPGRGAGLEARVAGRAELSGGFASLAEPTVVVQLPPTPARFQELPLTLEAGTIRLRAGVAATDGLRLTTESGSLEVAGQADLVRRHVEITGRGQVALRALSPLLQEAALAGNAELDVEVRGPFDALRTEGALEVQDATLRLRALPQAISGITGLIVFDGDRLVVERAQASLGGGPLTLTGSARLAGNRLEDARFEIAGRNLAMRYPVGLRSALDADLTLTGRSSALRLAGTVRVLRGVYDLDEAMLESVAATAASQSPTLRAIALDLALFTESPILVRGNIGEMRATGRLTLLGDMETPIPVGALTIEPGGGKVFLQGKEFNVKQGELTYAGTWNPTLGIEAQRQITNKGRGNEAVTVTVSLEGTLEKPTVRLSSAPPYSESEIISLIAVGNSADRTASLALGTEAASFLLGSRLSRSLRRLGFDEVSVQPELIARNDESEAEAGARFTFGKRLSNRVRLVYSLSLQDPEQRYVRVDMEPGRDVTLSAQRTDRGNKGGGAGQTFRWGSPPKAQATGNTPDRLRLQEVRLSGGPGIPTEELRRLLKVKAGDRRTIWQLQDDADGLREELVRRGFLEADVDVRLDLGAAVFQVRTGPRYTWEVTGMTNPPDLGQELRHALFVEEALEKGRERLLSVLHERGHLRAKVTTETRPDGEGRLLVFHVEAGPRLSASLRFPGATAFRQGRLRKIVGGPGRVLAEPEDAVADLEAAYRARHYLAAKIGPPRVVDRGGSVDIEIPVDEGRPAQVGEVRFEGATRPESELRAAVDLPPGRPYDDAAVLAATDSLRLHYFGLGHPNVRVSARAVPRPPDLDVAFQITEGPAPRVGSVVVQGATRTRLGLIRRQIRLKPGDPVDPRALSALEKRLLDLGVFSRAAVSVSSDDPATVTVTVEEGERAVAQYLLRYDEKTNEVTDKVKGQVRGDVQSEARNLFGRGLRVGGRYGRGTEIEDSRADLSLPSFLGQERASVSLSRLVEDFDNSEVPNAPPTRREQRIIHLQSQREVAERWRLLYGYRFKRTDSTSEAVTFTTDIAGFDLSAVTDTRDNALDARRGRFFSLSFEYSPPALRKLSGDFSLVKGLAQLFVATPLSDSLTWAHGYRLGLARGFKGEPVLSTERFKAGGANTIRGFATDSLGPFAPTVEGVRKPLGGESVVILNQELRYHHRWGLGGVVFYDGGNVFEKTLSFKLRHSVGFGLRWESPIGLVRADLGFPIRPQADRGESRRPRLFLSIGQAF
jgi:outer membrane protein assembly factor BamA/autotransporter translocation and assembly factor TamB